MRDFMSLTFVKKSKVQLQQMKNQNIYKVTSVDDTALSYNNRVVDHKMKDTQLQIGPHVWDMQFDITITDKHNVVLELLWLQYVNSKISFWHWTIDFSTGKLVHMSKEMSESDLQICTISADELKKKLWKNSEQVKILWSKQINLVTIKLTNSMLSEEYRDFAELFVNEASEETLSAH